MKYVQTWEGTLGTLPLFVSAPLFFASGVPPFPGGDPGQLGPLGALGLPKLIRLALPVGGVLVTLGAQVFHALGAHGIGGVGAGLGDHLAQALRVLQKGARRRWR